jgi:hypothetical protein
MNNGIKAVVTLVAPRFTRRWMVVSLLASFFTRPARIFHRLNRENIFLYKQFRRLPLRCGICGRRGTLFFDMPDRKLRRDHGIGVLRETLSCKSCGSTMRQRALAYAILTVVRERWGLEGGCLRDVFSRLDEASIWDTDAFSPISKMVKACRGGVLSKYLPKEPFGSELEPGIVNIDLQRIDFEADRFDVILSSDIMEHVRDDHAAHKEIYRCLRPGGAYIFTVPYNENEARTRYLVEPSVDGDVYLTRPHYHGDPLTGGILAYRIYGRDLLEALAGIGFEVRFLWIEAAAQGIFSGDCFIAIKPVHT